MPTYVYRCKNCGHEFEKFQGINAEPLHVCPECQGEVERVINGGIGLIFKGSGFYQTDYKNRQSSVSGNGKKETKPSATKSSTKSE
ncbi:MAG: zinc ribbon domain-containing protein [Calditrichaeota bacterium]|nr:MAG: zinc ribbon domain-containing protein [Calditrichota bacterium]